MVVADTSREPRFLCDSMLGGLARKLRLAGYDAVFAGPIDDGDLVRWALSADAFLLSSDGPLFRRRPVRDGEVRSLFVPRARPSEQVEVVLRALRLEVRAPRCLACGGEVVEVDKASVATRVPAPSFASFGRFFRCDRCDRVYWQGTHWDGIEAGHRELARRVAQG